MKGSNRSFSTLSGTLWIVSFLSLLFVFPLIFNGKTVRFSQDATANKIVGFDSFPLDAQLVVFRAGNLADNKIRKGAKTSLKTLIGNAAGPIIINFWATWCPPCLEELPSVEMLNRQLSQQNSLGLQKLPLLITISVDDRIEDILKLESSLDFKPSFAVLHDREGELARSLGTTKFPETYLVNPQGKILYKWLGPQNWLSADALRQIKSHLQ